MLVRRHATPLEPMDLQSAQLDHDLHIQGLRGLADRLAPQAAGAAFVQSLATRQLELRSALGSLALARVIPSHDLDPIPGTYAVICSVCGWSMMPPGQEEPESQFLDERRRYGGLRHLNPLYASFDLTAFAAVPAVEPTPEAWRSFALILRTPALLAPTARASDLERALKGAVKSNRHERQVLIRILACAGVLQPSRHPTFFDGFVPEAERVLPPQRFCDWGYPAIWWRGSDGVREEAVRFWFQESAWRAV
jgi:hypothetical protein